MGERTGGKVVEDVFEVKGNRVFLNSKEIGWMTTTMNGKKAYISPRNRPQHYFRIFEGWGLSRDVLEFLKQNRFNEVHLRIGLRETLISKIEDWDEHGIPYHRPPYEPQLVLPEKFMEKKVIPLSEVMDG
jgi:hypothetical protein